jgi:ATP-dependent RNA helicase DDX49/DBP8
MIPAQISQLLKLRDQTFYKRTHITMGITLKRSEREASRDAPPAFASGSESSGSDEEITEHQAGSRKRRKVSPESRAAPVNPISTVSRIQAKKKEVAPKNAPEVLPGVVDVKSTFASIKVAPWLIASLSSMEIKRPTGIQKEVIPEILKGRDWYVESCCNDLVRANSILALVVQEQVRVKL